MWTRWKMVMSLRSSSRHSGIHLKTGSSSFSFPSSTNKPMAVLKTALVDDAISKSESGPDPPQYHSATILPWRNITAPLYRALRGNVWREPAFPRTYPEIPALPFPNRRTTQKLLPRREWLSAFPATAWNTFCLLWQSRDLFRTAIDWWVLW